MINLAEVARAPQQARIKKRLTPEKLARHACVSRATLSRMETVARGDMSVAALLRRARAPGHELKLVERNSLRTLDDVLAELQAAKSAVALPRRVRK